VFAAGPCMESYTTGRPAVMHDAAAECSGGAGWWPDRDLGCVCRRPAGWDQSEVSALQACAGVVASLLGAAAKAERKDALADQLQVALDSRGLIERAKGALMERERLDDQEAFTHLRRAARSSGRKLSEVAREVAAGQPLPPRADQADQYLGRAARDRRRRPSTRGLATRRPRRVGDPPQGQWVHRGRRRSFRSSFHQAYWTEQDRTEQNRRPI
jgi:hypothetical protein